MQRNKTIHIIEVSLSHVFMQELYFEEFISFSALLFIYELLKFLASAFIGSPDMCVDFIVVSESEIKFCISRFYL
jgi:hypothetical protein